MITITTLTNRQQRIFDLLRNCQGKALSTREIAKELKMDWSTAIRELNRIYGMRTTLHRIERKNLTLWFIIYDTRKPVEDNWK